MQVNLTKSAGIRPTHFLVQAAIHYNARTSMILTGGGGEVTSLVRNYFPNITKKWKSWATAHLPLTQGWSRWSLEGLSSRWLKIPMYNGFNIRLSLMLNRLLNKLCLQVFQGVLNRCTPTFPIFYQMAQILTKWTRHDSGSKNIQLTSRFSIGSAACKF